MAVSCVWAIIGFMAEKRIVEMADMYCKQGGVTRRHRRFSPSEYQRHHSAHKEETAATEASKCSPRNGQI